ncbi:endogenous retrovirus group K member 8, partial [Chelydra serpentina]
EVQGVLLAAQHVANAHSANKQVVLGIDSQFCLDILIEQASPSAFVRMWDQIFTLIRKFSHPWFVTHCPSHRPDSNPLHSSLDQRMREVSQVHMANPAPQADPLLRWLHEEWGHLPPTKLYGLLSGFSDQKPDVSRSQCELIVQSCLQCVQVKTMNRPRYERSAYAAEHFAPGSTWQIDLIGPLPGARRFPKALVTVDLGSRQTFCVPLTKTNAASVAVALRQTAAARGTPTEVQADGGPPFTSKSIEQLIFGWGASLHIHTKYHPQSNGVVERKIAVLKTMLRTA